MDIVTHGLASLALARAFFPRAGKAAIASAVIVGTLPDADRLSAFLGPSAFLTWHRTYLHSLVAVTLLSLVLPTILAAAVFWGGFGIDLPIPEGEATPGDPSAKAKRGIRTLASAVLFAPLCAAILHIAMDAGQSQGVALFWPFNDKRVAADWLPGLDPWILAILLAAIALPELFHLVSAEIGAKEKRPRGQRGAMIGIVLVFAYVGVRAALHSNAMATLQSRTYRGEAAHRAGAYPEAVSLLTWHGIVETESALHEIAVDLTAGSAFDAESARNLYKPESSPFLDAGRNTEAAGDFLRIARFPRASLVKTETGYVFELRDLRYAAAGQTNYEVAAIVALDLNGRVTSQQFVWARDLRR